MSFFKPFSLPNGYLLIYIFNEVVRKTYLAHRLVAQEFIDNTENKPHVDHVDHDRQNNCVNNLRFASISENGMNRNKQQKPCSSCFKGVSWHKQRKKQYANIKTNTRHKFIGLFSSEIDAAQAYNDEAERLFGAFAHF